MGEGPLVPFHVEFSFSAEGKVKPVRHSVVAQLNFGAMRSPVVLGKMASWTS